MGFVRTFTLAAVATGSLTFGMMSSASACEQQEMQFFGTVRNVSRYIAGSTICTYNVTLVNEPMEPKPSLVCPLTPGEAESLTFVDKTCKLSNGDKISGIMVRKDNQAWIE